MIVLLWYSVGCLLLTSQRGRKGGERARERRRRILTGKGRGEEGDFLGQRDRPRVSVMRGWGGDGRGFRCGGMEGWGKREHWCVSGEGAREVFGLGGRGMFVAYRESVCERVYSGCRRFLITLLFIMNIRNCPPWFVIYTVSLLLYFC